MSASTNRVEFTLVNSYCMWYGKRGSGKSRLLRFLLACEKDQFEDVFLICPTEEINNFYEGYIHPTRILSEYKEEWGKMLLEKMTSLNKGKKPTDPDFHQVLVIMDDVCSDLDLTNRAKYLHLARLVKRGRHAGIGLLMTAQYPNDMGKGSRTNADFTLIGQLNAAAADIVCTDCRFGNISKRDWMALYHRATANYGFLLTRGKNVKDNTDLSLIYGVVRCPPEFVD